MAGAPHNHASGYPRHRRSHLHERPDHDHESAPGSDRKNHSGATGSAARSQQSRFFGIAQRHSATPPFRRIVADLRRTVAAVAVSTRKGTRRQSAVATTDVVGAVADSLLEAGRVWLWQHTTISAQNNLSVPDDDY